MSIDVPRYDKDGFHSAQDSLKNYMRNGITKPQYSEGGREIAANYTSVKYQVAGRPHSCLCNRE